NTINKLESLPDIKSWWLVGAVLTILTFLVHITLGVWWWNMLIGWNML
ncbi:anion permease, partial [Escherichia coli]